MTWLLDKFKGVYYPELESHGSLKFALKRGLQDGLYRRGDGFQLMFELLLSRPGRDYKIIETGTLRNPGNWKDGQSAFLFTEFVDNHGGTVRSVDIDSEACASAKAAISSPRFSVTCSDSVQYLKNVPDLSQVDLFYLDSWDVKWHADQHSAEHHLKEFQTIEPFLSSGTVVAIDDNARFLSNGQRTGKGRLIAEYLDSKGIMPVYDRYQIIYQF
jgi:cephalosporin hydroxylase